MAILELGLISTDELLSNHEALLREFLFSKIMRDDDAVINKALDKLKLTRKLCIYFITKYKGTFCISSQIFGTHIGRPIYIVNEKKHFFLAKIDSSLSSVTSRNSASLSSNPVPSSLPPPKSSIRPFSYEAIASKPCFYETSAFGPPPDSSCEEDSDPGLCFPHSPPAPSSAS